MKTIHGAPRRVIPRVLRPPTALPSLFSVFRVLCLFHICNDQGVVPREKNREKYIRATFLQEVVYRVLKISPPPVRL